MAAGVPVQNFVHHARSLLQIQIWNHGGGCRRLRAADDGLKDSVHDPDQKYIPVAVLTGIDGHVQKQYVHKLITYFNSSEHQSRTDQLNEIMGIE